ncbi:glycosyltransferase involved in cell wall biosynthesis [Rheinheimera pacifica]|uniref:glycosyltransferase n=1 Tax=Rheinheimera pacifica TaxID=173990 RepID=UPI002169154C|nr:glycosyltransferase [Rheinheimera pacifica]MCS4308811.1 glycosyltransferase involved in cell wall biosynthesis [Rheinheimera pacifica]
MEKALIVGLPFFAEKYNYMLNAYNSIGIHPRVLINSDCVDYGNHFDMHFAGRGTFSRMYNYAKTIRTYNPDFIDCYDYSILSLYYVSVAKVLGVKVRFWLIGGELKGDKTHFNRKSFFLSLFVNVKKVLTRQSLRLSDKIFAKEVHHLDSIKSIGEDLLAKVVSIYNCVPVEESYHSRSKLSKDFIYANAVIESRNVKSLVEAFSSLKKNNFVFSASIFGFNSISNVVYGVRGESYSNDVLELYKELDIGDVVSVDGFIKDISVELIKHKFFLFPAEVILANYALLEAMSLGLVPIIFPGDGYEKIITDGVNGIVAFDFDIYSALERALKLSEDDYAKMSEAAYQKIKNEFSLSHWSSKLLDTL